MDKGSFLKVQAGIHQTYSIIAINYATQCGLAHHTHIPQLPVQPCHRGSVRPSRPLSRPPVPCLGSRNHRGDRAFQTVKRTLGFEDANFPVLSLPLSFPRLLRMPFASGPGSQPLRRLQQRPLSDLWKTKLKMADGGRAKIGLV